jgi:hypothetical protein
LGGALLQEVPMERVTGGGEFFFRARDPKTLKLESIVATSR